MERAGPVLQLAKSQSPPYLLEEIFISSGFAWCLGLGDMEIKLADPCHSGFLFSVLHRIATFKGHIRKT